MNEPQLSQDPTAIKSRAYRAAHPDKVREYEQCRSAEQKARRLEQNRLRRQANRDAINAKQKEKWASRAPEQIEETRRKQREYNAKNKERIAQLQREYRLANKEKLRLYQLEYQRNNREKISAQQRQYIESSPTRKIIKSFGARLRELFKKWHRKGVGGFSKYLEADGSVYATHIESQFEPWMTWENHGIEWELDHIVPSSVLGPFFGREDMLAEKAVNQLCNIRPLKWEKNIVKHDQVPDALRVDLSKLIQENPVNPDLMAFVRKWSVLMRDWMPENPTPSA